MPCSVSCSAWLNSSLATHALTPDDLAHMETTATVRGSRESQQAWDRAACVIRTSGRPYEHEAGCLATHKQGRVGHRSSASHLEHQS